MQCQTDYVATGGLFAFNVVGDINVESGQSRTGNCDARTAECRRTARRFVVPRDTACAAFKPTHIGHGIDGTADASRGRKRSADAKLGAADILSNATQVIFEVVVTIRTDVRLTARLNSERGSRAEVGPGVSSVLHV